MAKFDRFLIAPINSGLQTNLKSWLIPDDAYAQLNNAHVFRGRVRKRFGSRFMGSGWSSAQTEPLFSRLRINVGTTAAVTGNFGPTVIPVGSTGAIWKIGQQFSIGTTIFTVVVANGALATTGIAIGATDSSGNASGTFAGGTVGQEFNINGTIFTISGVGLNPFTVTGLGIGTGTYNTGTGAYTFVGASPSATIYFTAATGTFDTTTGTLTIVGNATNATTAIWFYPSEPVMGLTNYGEGAINNKPSYAFDTRFAYVFAGGFWQRSGATTIPIWHGTNLNFFWSTNWQGISTNPAILFTTNFFVTNYDGAGAATDDPIWYFDGTTWKAALGNPNGWYFLPNGGAPYTGPFILTARIILPFKDRLLLLNTVESSGNATGANIGTTDAGGAQAGVTAGGVVGQVFAINGTYFTIVTAGNFANPLSVSGAGVGTGTYNTVTGAWTFTGASPLAAILFPATLGTNTNYVNRVRFCHNGSPFATNAWYEPGQTDSVGGINGVGDGGDWLDATTEEAIISAEFIKDRLIVYFERSTWELAYTGNQVLPFAWQKINTELGSESTFSTVPFDREILTIGNTGVHSCSGANVIRIDDKIPSEIFEISNRNLGVQRVAGIRDYFAEMVYWTFPSNNQNPVDTYPNRVLVYNYVNGAWAFNDDCITTFGYFEQQQGMTWASTTLPWMSASFSWNSGTVSVQFRQVIAGNQQGYVFIVDSTETSKNARAMQITALSYFAVGLVQLTIIDHTLSNKSEYISIENASGITQIVPKFYEVVLILDKDNFLIGDFTSNISGVYTGGGNSARISRISIVSKQWNPYVDQDRNIALARIDFGVTKTSKGKIAVDYSPSSADISLLHDGGPIGTNALMGTGVLQTFPYDVSLAPLEQNQERLWHPIYFQSDGTCIQIRMYLNNDHMADPEIAWSFFELQGLVLFCAPTSSRLQ